MIARTVGIWLAIFLYPLFSRSGAALVALIALPFFVGRTMLANGVPEHLAGFALVLPALIIGWALYRPAEKQIKLDVLGGVQLFLRYVQLVAAVGLLFTFFHNGLKLSGLLSTAIKSIGVLVPWAIVRVIHWWIERDELRLDVIQIRAEKRAALVT